MKLHRGGLIRGVGVALGTKHEHSPFRHRMIDNALSLSVDCQTQREQTSPRCWREVSRGSGVELLGGLLLVGTGGHFGHAQGVAALVLLLHAVGDEQDQEEGAQEPDHAACDHR